VLAPIRAPRRRRSASTRTVSTTRELRRSDGQFDFQRRDELHRRQADRASPATRMPQALGTGRDLERHLVGAASRDQLPRRQRERHQRRHRVWRAGADVVLLE
jgi:hypothetical protein